MKKSFVIIVLAALHGACSSQQPLESENYALLTFVELATEITVGYQEIDARPEIETATSASNGSP